ncbi:MAG: HAD-IIIC family phosphatase [Vicinamibacterales bacterium]
MIEPTEQGMGAEDQWRAFQRDWASAHDYRALLRLSRQAASLADHPEIDRRLVPVRLGVLSEATIDLLLPILKTALLAIGLRPSLYLASYGQVSASLLDSDGPLVRFLPQITLIINATPHLPGWPALHDSRQQVEDRIDEVCRSLLGPCEIFHERTGSDVILNTYHPMSSRPAGNLGAKLPGDPTNFVRRLNVALGDRAPRYVHLNDVAALAERAGTETWFDEHYWHLAKQPVSFHCISDYCRNVAGIIGAILGRAKKCLVLDLDNTLWGGIIGDDGIGGIQIGEGTAAGEAFKAIQVYLKSLRERGVLLAVCSKNDESVARAAFTDHPDMVLRLDDFAAFRANWSPKSENIRVIAGEMDLPLDAFVLFDDNPAEREEVALAIPEVTVVPLPEDPSGYVRALERSRLFEVSALTREDLGRTAAYRARQQTREVRAQITDVRSYLASLAMRAAIGPFEESSLERITQLINKTNQFNLTTPRVVLAEMRRLLVDPAAVTCSVRLRDRFADHGLISVMFGRIDSSRLTIDAWLMSCRVLGRGVERLLFNYLLELARTRGLREIAGVFRPTERNRPAKDLYQGLGFSRVATREGVEDWLLDVTTAAPAETFIAVDEISVQP